jgi:hypothetical protein
MRSAVGLEKILTFQPRMLCYKAAGRRVDLHDGACTRRKRSGIRLPMAVLSEVTNSTCVRSAMNLNGARIPG